ncbi:DinB family protein [Mesobacillus thioparans]|uniref:DinB family protein n=1 Tax=Mesobacillus thioparans TaxID=370439 RepID=UPI0039F09BAA
MFQSINRFVQSWEYEANNTQRLLLQLTDESLCQESSPDHWTLGRVAWHIVTAVNVIASQAGLEFESPNKDFPVPESATYIADTYQQACSALVESIRTQWTDDDLSEKLDFFGQKMSRGTLLLFLIQHQIHHRGQMTVLMRQAGLKVPGVFGPSKEEWSHLGMEAPRM